MPSIDAKAVGPAGSILPSWRMQLHPGLHHLVVLSQNNLDPDVAERPEDLVVYGGRGQAARNWEAFDAILATAQAGRRRDAACAIAASRWLFSAPR